MAWFLWFPYRLYIRFLWVEVMGEPYPMEAGSCSYTHIRLANFPYEARYKSLLALLRQDITCEKLIRVGYIQIGLRSMQNLLLIIFYPGLAWGGVCRLWHFSHVWVKTLSPRVTLYGMKSQKRGMICSSPLAHMMCKKSIMAGFKSVPGGYNPISESV